MGQYVYDYEGFSFAMTIPDYWHKVYAGKPREPLYGCYTLVLDWVKKMSKGRAVLDIGVNHGIFAIPCSLMGYKVVGFEPVFANFESSVLNMYNNKCRNAHLFNFALSNKNESVEIYVPECSDNASLSPTAAVANLANKAVAVETVQSIRFDDWILEHPEFNDIGFVKIDTQGAEYSIIEGMSNFLRGATDIYLIVEYEAHLNKMGYSYEQLDELILSLGVKLIGDITGGDKLFYKGREKINELTPMFFEELPEKKEPGILYISEEYGKTAVHLCACGCGVQSVTPIGEGEWTLTKNEGKVTLRPSIGNFSGENPYHAHYHITENKIEW